MGVTMELPWFLAGAAGRANSLAEGRLPKEGGEKPPFCSLLGVLSLDAGCSVLTEDSFAGSFL